MQSRVPSFIRVVVVTSALAVVALAVPSASSQGLSSASWGDSASDLRANELRASLIAMENRLRNLEMTYEQRVRTLEERLVALERASALGRIKVAPRVETRALSSAAADAGVCDPPFAIDEDGIVRVKLACID